MNAVEYLRERTRMTKGCTRECSDCPLARDTRFKCIELESKYPEKAIEIVERWSIEHPVKTYKMDFFEKHPKAKKDANGNPLMCIVDVYGEEAEFKECEYRIDKCIDCWNRPMPEVEK